MNTDVLPRDRQGIRIPTLSDLVGSQKRIGAERRTVGGSNPSDPPIWPGTCSFAGSGCRLSARALYRRVLQVRGHGVCLPHACAPFLAAQPPGSGHSRAGPPPCDCDLHDRCGSAAGGVVSRCPDLSGSPAGTAGEWSGIVCPRTGNCVRNV